MGLFYRILIVEDQEDVRRSLSTFLREKGHACGTASDGVEALEKAAGERFDAVIADIRMPNMDGIALTKELRKRHANLAVMIMTGFTAEYSEEDAINAGASDFIAKPFALTEFSARFHRMMRDHAAFEDIMKRSRLHDSAIRDSQEKIEELRREIEGLRGLAHYDPLTGLLNRTMFYDRLKQCLESARRYSHMLGLLFVDLDHFKDINDTLGHDKGDLLLKEVSERIAACVRKADVVARMGGDEFTVILAHLADDQEAISVAQRIITSLSERFCLGDRECSISASIGISLYPQDGGDAETLLKKADTAMYRVKEQGRNGYQFYEYTETAPSAPQEETRESSP